MTHDFKHADIQKYIDEHLSRYENLVKITEKGGCVRPSFDGLELNTL